MENQSEIPLLSPLTVASKLSRSPYRSMQRRTVSFDMSVVGMNLEYLKKKPLLYYFQSSCKFLQSQNIWILGDLFQTGLAKFQQTKRIKGFVGAKTINKFASIWDQNFNKVCLQIKILNSKLTVESSSGHCNRAELVWRGSPLRRTLFAGSRNAAGRLWWQADLCLEKNEMNFSRNYFKNYSLKWRLPRFQPNLRRVIELLDIPPAAAHLERRKSGIMSNDNSANCY